MKFNLKKYIDKRFIICTSAVVLLLASSILGVVLSTKNSSNSGQITANAHSYKSFFKNRSIDKKASINKEINWNAHKITIFDYLTTWRTSSTNHIKFDFDKIKTSILPFVKSILEKEIKTQNISDFYINIKYQLNNSYNLKLDIRWANSSDVQNKNKTPLYWSSTLLTINN
ncbi:MAG: hypothetical protein ACRC4M_00370 [Mycoplasma sp.]